MKKEHVIFAVLVALFFAVFSPVFQDLGYTIRIADFIRSKISNLPIDVDDILKHN